MIILIVLLIGLPLSFVIRSALDGGWREVTSVEVLRANEVIYVPDMRVFLVDHDPPLALRAVSTHLEEPVAYCREASTFQELAHGSKWDRFGYYLDGPAPRGMDRLSSRVVDGIVEVHGADLIPGPPRGAGPPEQPTGPFCEYENAADSTNGFLDALSL